MNNKPIRALVVDDEELIAELLAETLRASGVEVTTAFDAKDALQTYLNMLPDIVFSDYIMPDIDGIQLMKSLKAIEPKLPVVLFSGYYEKLLKAVEKESIKPEATMRKPFLRVDKINEIMNNLIANSRLKPM